MTRSAAKISGERFYQGAPCRYGHKGVRYTSTGNCYHCLHERAVPVFSSRTFHGHVADLEILEQMWEAMQTARRAASKGSPE